MVLAGQFRFCKNRMNLSMANAVQNSCMASAMGLWNEVVFVALQLGYCSIAQRANHFFWQGCHEMTPFGLNLFLLNAPGHDKTIA